MAPLCPRKESLKGPSAIGTTLSWCEGWKSFPRRINHGWGPFSSRLGGHTLVGSLGLDPLGGGCTFPRSPKVQAGPSSAHSTGKLTRKLLWPILWCRIGGEVIVDRIQQRIRREHLEPHKWEPSWKSPKTQGVSWSLSFDAVYQNPTDYHVDN